jgi:hypothetical protein
MLALAFIVACGAAAAPAPPADPWRHACHVDPHHADRCRDLPLFNGLVIVSLGLG